MVKLELELDERLTAALDRAINEIGPFDGAPQTREDTVLAVLRHELFNEEERTAYVREELAKMRRG